MRTDVPEVIGRDAVGKVGSRLGSKKSKFCVNPSAWTVGRSLLLPTRSTESAKSLPDKVVLSCPELTNRIGAAEKRSPINSRSKVTVADNGRRSNNVMGLTALLLSDYNRRHSRVNFRVMGSRVGNDEHDCRSTTRAVRTSTIRKSCWRERVSCKC